MTESTVSGLIIRLLIPVLVCLSAVSCSPLAAGPAHVAAVSGDTVNITCRRQPTVSYADWARVLSGNVAENEICLNGNCVNGYRRRFSVDVTDNFRLTVLNVSTKDIGKYTCIVIDDSEIRYATILDVADRITDSAHKATVTAILVEATSTTVTQHVTDVSYTVTVIAIVIVMFIVVAAAIVVSVYFITRRNGQRGCLCFGTNAKPATETDTNKGEDNCGKLLDVDMDESQKKKGANEHIEETTTPQVSMPIKPPARKDSDELLSVMLFLKIFRVIDTGKKNVSSSSSASFKLVAYASTLCWNKLIEKNAKHQIRRLLYYYRSGYGRYATCLQQLPSTASDNVPVTGVSVLNGDVYIIHKDSNTVQVLQSTQTKQIIVPDMKRPVDIVACTSVQGLYIADEQARCVWLADINHSPVKCVKCVTFAERVPIALSLRRDSLLVTTNTQIIVKHSKEDGTFMEISLRTESHVETPVEPQHAVETSLSTLLVAFKEGRGYNLAEFDFNGQQLRKFVCVAGLLRFPSYIVLDSSERLLVADFDNKRILLVDAKLEPLRACAILRQQRDGIVAPQRFCSDHVTGELFVVQTAINSLDVTTYVVKKYANASTTSMPKRRPTSQNYHTA